MIKQVGLACFFGVFLIGLLSQNITCPPVLPERVGKIEASTPHMSANESLEHDPVRIFLRYY